MRSCAALAYGGKLRLLNRFGWAAVLCFIGSILVFLRDRIDYNMSFALIIPIKYFWAGVNTQAAADAKVLINK